MEKLLAATSPRGKTALVISIGGGADIVLAKAIAMNLLRGGAQKVDIVQTKARKAFDDDTVKACKEDLALVELPGFSPNDFLVYKGTVPNRAQDSRIRSRGNRLAAALRWTNGDRFFAAGRSPAWKFFIQTGAGTGKAYDLVIGVDGGGDVLGVENSSDMQVLDNLDLSCPAQSDLLLLVIGKGADGTPIQSFENEKLIGWTREDEWKLSEGFADELESCLRETSCWLDEPVSWKNAGSLWTYGLNVPQIVALGIRRLYPYGTSPGGLVSFPRRYELVSMRPEWIASAYLYRPRKP